MNYKIVQVGRVLRRTFIVMNGEMNRDNVYCIESMMLKDFINIMQDILNV